MKRRIHIPRGRGTHGYIQCPVCEEGIEYRGYHDPGKLTGPWEDCYPPESDVEVEFHKECDLTSAQISEIESQALHDEGPSDDDYPDPPEPEICHRYYDGT
jgi:hypothetical protein